MKRAYVLLIFLVIGMSFVSSIDSIPQPQDKYVNDFAGVLNAGQSVELRSLFASVEQDTTAQVVFVSVSECSPYSPNDLAVQIGNTWGVGNKDNSNGLIILYCLNENKIFVATGLGMGGIFPASKIGRLLDENYVPLRDSGNVSEGIMNFARVAASVMEDNKVKIQSGQAGPQTSYIPVIFFLIVLFFFGFLVYLISKRKKKKGFGDFWTFFFVDFLFRMIIYSIIFRGGNRNSSGGGFGGGGGGFGGGGFGGGGAGR